MKNKSTYGIKIDKNTKDELCLWIYKFLKIFVDQTFILCQVLILTFSKSGQLKNALTFDACQLKYFC